MSDVELTLLGARDLRNRIAAGELSPVALLEASLGRIERHNGDLNAMVGLSGTALDQARDLESSLGAGAEPGPLCGLPVGVDDGIPVRGLRHTSGSLAFADRIAEADAVVVQRLRDAGAIVVGKTNAAEMGLGADTSNEVFGATRNPWNPETSAGGAAGGGAAALAAGMVALVVANDLDGGVRVPASCCGVVGLRPGPGLIPAWPAAHPWDTLEVTGLIARRAEDLALGLQALAGPSPRAPLGYPVDERELEQQFEVGMPPGTRIGYCADLGGLGVDPEVDDLCSRLVERLGDRGASVERIEFDISWARDAFLALRRYGALVRQLDRLDDREKLGAGLRAELEAGLELSARDHARAEADRGRVFELFQRFFAHFDFLLTPTLAAPPLPLGEGSPSAIADRALEAPDYWLAPTFLLSLSGLPVVSVPAGRAASGGAVGLQVVGARAGEGRVLGLGAAIRESVDLGDAPLA